jgi:hypothetical protein
MTTLQPLWTPGDDWLPTRGAPEWIHLDWLREDSKQRQHAARRRSR